MPKGSLRNSEPKLAFNFPAIILERHMIAISAVRATCETRFAYTVHMQNTHCIYRDCRRTLHRLLKNKENLISLCALDLSLDHQRLICVRPDCHFSFAGICRDYTFVSA